MSLCRLCALALLAATASAGGRSGIVIMTPKGPTRTAVSVIALEADGKLAVNSAPSACVDRSNWCGSLRDTSCTANAAVHNFVRFKTRDVALVPAPHIHGACSFPHWCFAPCPWCLLIRRHLLLRCLCRCLCCHLRRCRLLPLFAGPGTLENVMCNSGIHAPLAQLRFSGQDGREAAIGPA